uniref:Uncharacterized protein n=1 Tax=Avena sativa TaxID=4498 RepID=A0ACD5Y3P9_AVESA
MATGQKKSPSFFNFLKEGLLLPSRNRRLFTAVCALILASTTLLKTTEPGKPDFAKLLREIKNDTKELLLVGAGYPLFAFVVRSVVQIVVLFAAVSTYSGDDRQRATTFGALLGKAKAQIKGPLLTLAFVYVLETVSSSVYVVLVTLMTSLLGVLTVKQYLVTLLVASLLLLTLILTASVCIVYFSFLCSFSLAVAVAEPGRHGAAALAKAWRLVKGKKRQVVLYEAVTGVLAAAVSPVGTLAKEYAGNSVALGLLLGSVYAVLLALLKLLSVCAMTVFYYESREDMDSQLGATGYYAIAINTRSKSMTISSTC